MSNQENNELELLQKQIEELNSTINQLQDEKKDLQAELEKYKQIATSAQSQYVLLKYDFDGLINRTQKEKAESEVKALVDYVKKFLPFIEQLKKSIENIPNDIKDNQWVNWVIMTYNNITSKLNSWWVSTIESIGLEPHHDYHEPLGFEATDEANKGKIVKEVETWYIYKKEEKEIVIKPSKVIIGN